MATVAHDLIEGTNVGVSHELAVSAQEASAQRAIEVSMAIAQRFPRNEDAAFARVIRSCNRTTFADLAVYSFPRGGSVVEGPSVNLAREIGRCWGNIQYGTDIVHDSDESRTVRAWAWDMETNTRRNQDATFKKLIYRKGKGWVAPDERDLRELTNKHGETALRNCLLHLVPPDLVEDALTACRETLKRDATKDPDAARKGVIKAFSGLGIKVEDLEQFLGHRLSLITAEEIAQLRSIWKSISDGNSKWSEYVQPTTTTTASPSTGAVSGSDLTGNRPATSTATETTPETPPEGQGNPETATDSATTSGEPEAPLLSFSDFPKCKTLQAVTMLESELLATCEDADSRAACQQHAETARERIRKGKHR